MSRERVRQLVRRRRRGQRASGSRHDEAALRLRYHVGRRLLESLEPPDRMVLLSFVVWPSRALAEASLARVAALRLPPAPRRRPAREAVA